MEITFTLEVTGDENLLDTFAHQQMLDLGEAIRTALDSAAIPREAVALTFHGDNLLSTF